LRGPLQIESENTATHPSPLTYVSVSVLNQNEALYKSRSLPAIEYTLSRPRAHFATEVTSNTPSGYVTTNSTKITVPSTFFGTAYWQGLHDLLGRRNPWIATLALTNGSIRYDVGTVPRWLEKLGHYRLSPSDTLLQEVQADCNAWLATEFQTAKTNPAAISAFYHFGYYPFWWGLLDLYETTKNPVYLNYAEEGAFHTIAGIFSFPMPPAGNVIANAGGNYMSNATVWWKGPVRYRLGWPRTPGDTPERSVPAWLVSPVGYTLEQPSTYYTLDAEDSPFNLQMMAAWAPQLLRLYRHTGRPIYEVYARNAIIGRFSNDPGYYVRGFTDMFHDPLYPYKGPDVSSIYYHHIQARLAFVVDYLMAQAESMSAGNVAFPWVKQQGYVWFTDRIFGSSPGTLYGESGVWPWLDRNAIQVNTEQVDYLLARSRDSLWVVLMNQTKAPVTVNLTNHADALKIITSQPVQVFEAAETRPDRAYAAPFTVTVPARKLVALRFTTQSRDVFPREVALTSTPVTQTLPGAWGTLHAFRIRSPFGSDSLFVIVTGRPPATASAKLLLDGAPPVSKTFYPYEFSVYPWPMDQEMRFRLELTDGTITYSSPVVLPGTSTPPPTAYEEWKTANGLPVNAPDNGDSDGDGWANLLEYAFKLNPQVADAPSANYSSDGSALRLRYVKWRSDISYFVETSLDLHNWTREGVTETESGGTVTASVPLSAQARFLRLVVSYP
jgi:RNAse (barnase) inhibitor barstar